MKKILLIAAGVLIVGVALITLIFYFISRESAVTTREVVTAPNPTEEYQKFVNDTIITNIYLGTFPCEDCDGTETVLSLSRADEDAVDGTFTITRTYLGTELDSEEYAGAWSLQQGSVDGLKANVYLLTFDKGNQEMYEEIDSEKLVLLDEKGAQMQESKEYTLALQ